MIVHGDILSPEPPRREGPKMAEDPKSAASAVPPSPLHVRSDDMLGRVLGGNLMGATARLVGLVAVAGVVLATIAALVG
jgi:hypothetical protein